MVLDLNNGGTILKNQITGEDLKKSLVGSRDYLVLNKEMVNELNVFPVPDGDTGTNMGLTIISALKEAEHLDSFATVEEVSAAVSRGALMGARGNSGVILSQFFRGFAEGLKGKEVATIKDLAFAFKKASDVTYKAVMKPTEGTILTVGRELSDFAVKNAAKATDMGSFYESVIKAAEKSLDNTPNLLPVLKEQGVVDAGGKGLVVILQGALKAAKGETIEKIEDAELERKTPKAFVDGEVEDDDIEFAYCTEFLIKGDSDKAEEFKQKLIPLGDCLLVVGASGIIKTHIHTNNPGRVLEYASEIGMLQDIKIDNMRIQHKEKLFKDEEVQAAKGKNRVVEPTEEYAFVTVSIGDGLDEVFESLNADYIVKGGQTMNPSTEDLLKGVESTPGKNVFILPNNKNIQLAAEQVKELTKRNVKVIPTRSIPEGISAMLAFQPDTSFDENEEAMKEAISHVKSGQVTYAVRDTEISGKKIGEGDVIGIAHGDIVSVGSEVTEVACELIEELVNEDHSLITLYYGEDVDEEDGEKLLKELEEEYEDLDIELVYGGQPLYYYLVSLE